MQDSKLIMTLNFKLDEDLGIISYDTIRSSSEFENKSHDACRQLFTKLNRKYRDKHSVLYSVLYIDRETNQKRSVVIGESEAEVLARNNDLIDLDYFAIYLKDKHHSEDFVKTHVCQRQITHIKSGSTQSDRPTVSRPEEERFLKKVNTGQDSEDAKTKKHNAQNVFTNNTKGKQTIMSFFGKK